MGRNSVREYGNIFKLSCFHVFFPDFFCVLTLVLRRNVNMLLEIVVITFIVVFATGDIYTTD